MSFIPGYIATLSVDGQVINQVTSDAGLNLVNETLDKTTLGVSHRVKVPGLQDGSWSAQMHLDTASIVALQAAYDSTVAVTFVFRPGALGANDAGQWAGSCIIASFDVTGVVDDNWSLAIDAEITSKPVYTAPV